MGVVVGQRFQTFQQIGLRLLLAQLLLAGALFHGSRLLAQARESQDGVNGRVATMTAELDRRLTVVENLGIDKRIGILESDMREVKLMGRTVAIAVVGQLLMLITGQVVEKRRR